jgi:hypothetical protein
VGRDQPVDLARFRPQALDVRLDARINAHDAQDQASEIADRDAHSGTEIEAAAHDAFRRRRRDEAGDGIGDVSQVPDRRRGAKSDCGAAAEGLSDDGRDHGPRRLTRPEGVEGPQYNGLHRETIDIGFDELVRTDLAGGIGRLRLQGMRLVDRDITGAAIGFRRARMDEARRSAGPYRLQDVQRAADVGGDIAARRGIRIGNGDQRAEVEDRLATLHGPMHEPGVGQIAVHDLHLRKRVGGEKPEVALAGFGVVVQQRTHARTLLDERCNEVAADESAGARHQCSLALHVTLRCLPRRAVPQRARCLSRAPAARLRPVAGSSLGGKPARP